jgi:hypothetical protein
VVNALAKAEIELGENGSIFPRAAVPNQNRLRSRLALSWGLLTAPFLCGEPVHRRCPR